MLLPAILESILLYGGLLIVALGLVFYTVVRDERRNRAEASRNLPEAKLVGGKDPERIRRWLPFAMMAFGLALALVIGFKTTDVIVVTGDGNDVSATRKIRLFGSDDYTLAPGFEGPTNSSPTWVVNESSRVVRIKTVNYGRTLGWGRDVPTVIPPNTAAAAYRIDHVGPSDPPPTQVTSSTKLGMEWRYWLTWD